MPGGDRTGPMGMGPRTGRGAGFCSGFNVPGFMNSFGRGFGRGFFGRGGGRGWRNMFYATGLTGWQRAQAGPSAAGPAPRSPEEDLAALKQQAESAAATLDALRKRIDEIENAQPRQP